MIPASVAIVAMGPSHVDYIGLSSALGNRRRLADETWAINSMATVIEHDLLFHMDDCKLQEARAKANPQGYVAGMVDWLKHHPRFITSKVYDDYPGAESFPLQDVIDRFGHVYFNGTVAYAFVYALHVGVQAIQLYGCDYSYADTVKAEKGRGCLEFWIGLATGMGVSVTIANHSSLMDMNAPLNDRIYGYDAYQLELVTTDKKPTPNVVATPKALPSAQEIEKRYGNQ